MKLSNTLFMPFFLLIGGLFAGCSTTPSAQPPAGFLSNYSQLSEGFYFQQEHIQKGADFSQYKMIKVAPINFSYLSDKTACSSEELEDLGKAFRENIEKELTQAGFVITPTASGKALVLSIAITNVEPPAALLNAAADAADAISPVPIVLPFDTDGATAFEGQVTDGPTDKVLLTFMDKQIGAGKNNIDAAAMAVGGYAKFVNTEAVFKGWAANIAELMQKLRDGKTLKKKSTLGPEAAGLAVAAAEAAIP